MGFSHLGVLGRLPATPKRARYNASITFSWLEDKGATKIVRKC